MIVRTRFAPSPTGYLHIGGARTALFAWLFARHHNGEFVLRVEDTDIERSTEASVKAITDGLSWLGLDVDKGPIFQSDRVDRYRDLLQQLLQNGNAYHCYCSREQLDQERQQQKAQGLKPRYSGRCRDLAGTHHQEAKEPVIRFRNPSQGVVVFEDQVRGRIAISNQELDDLVIARANGMPTYNFAVVADDLDMEISHVIRGDDHINNTPRQINILEALGARPPIYAHVPMIVNSDGQRLSKRHEAVSVLEYKEQGFLPEALRNYLIRLGWSAGDQEIFSLKEMIEKFDILNVNGAAAAFDIDKLRWFNQHYIKNADVSRLSLELAHRLKGDGVDINSGPALINVVEVLQERCETLVELTNKSKYFFEEFEEYDEIAAKKHLRSSAEKILISLRDEFILVDAWEVFAIKEVVYRVAENNAVKLGKIAQPLRVAVSGNSATPPIDETVALVGKDRTISRIGRALKYIEDRQRGAA
ncbi:MAG: glutamate--tRNA ligase [Acidiferrobacteraceae bacterium]|nr:glutamate--tRNA ligase [Acidiferrobacteraceae bacterium]